MSNITFAQWKHINDENDRLKAEISRRAPSVSESVEVVKENLTTTTPSPRGPK